MVSVNPELLEQQELYLDSSGMPLPGINELKAVSPAISGGGSVVLPAEEHSKKARKPYTITKSRESWTEQEHDKFLEALQLFDRDWKKIEAFVGSKTVIQIRSHAQKYFLKVQKSGSNERLPPPRPKRKAAHPYPHNASKTASVANQLPGQYPSSPGTTVQAAYVYHTDSASVLTNQSSGPPAQSWSFASVPPVNSPILRRDDAALAMPRMILNNCCSSRDESARPWPSSQATEQLGHPKRIKVAPDFAQVYKFIGSVFDPDEGDHLQRLKRMDPINVETVLLLMKNLSANLLSPDFEEHRKLFSTYYVETGKSRSCSPVMSIPDNSKMVIPAV